MKIHEHQARELLAQFDIPVPPGEVAESGEEAAKLFDRLVSEHGIDRAVVKAQVHAGGRGKGGGVQLVQSRDEARDAADQILSRPLVTPQTGEEGVRVDRVLVSAATDIEQEFYVGMAVDRGRGAPVLMASAEGGVEIEEVAARNPAAILREPVDPIGGLGAYQGRKLAYGLGFTGRQAKQTGQIMRRLAKLFLEKDAALVEVNPLVTTTEKDKVGEGNLLAIDAKISFDDNAVARHKDLEALREPAEQTENERRASQAGLNYVQLDGNVGCLVNGAGLAMSTMDLIKYHGGEPANFLDVGGGASEEAVTEAFRIILGDDKVEGVLVNIFGGIMKCDVIARAIVGAAKQVGFQVPVVVRLEGTNVEQAREILEGAREQLPTLQTAEDLTDAAAKITQAIQ